MSNSIARSCCGILAVILLMGGCEGDGTTGPVVLQLTGVTAPPATDTVGTVAGTVVSVRVDDLDGNPQAGIPVLWSVSGGGSVAATASTTDAAGIATTTWTLGGTTGEQKLVAKLGDADSVTFVVNTVADRAASVTFTPDSVVLESLGDSVSVTPIVEDQFGNAVAAPTVTFTSADVEIVAVTPAGFLRAAGDGTAMVTATADTAHGTIRVVVRRVPASVDASPDAATLAALGDTLTVGATVHDANGFAIPDSGASWASLDASVATVNGDGRVQAVGNGSTGIVATSGGVSDTVTITVTQAVGSLEKVAGDGQTASAGTAVTVPPTVRVEDALGNPIAGIAVTFAVASGGGAVTGALDTTDASGNAQSGSWTLGGATGANTLTATAGGVSVTFTATATAPNTCVVSALAIPDSVEGQWQEGDCRTAEGTRLYDRHALPAGPLAFALDLSGPVGKQLKIFLGDREIGGPTSTGTSTLRMRALLPADSFHLQVRSPDTASRASYTLVSTANASLGCDRLAYAARGITTPQTLETTDCTFENWYEDRVLVRLLAGESMAVQLHSSDYAPKVVIRNPSSPLGTHHAIDIAGDTGTARLTWTAATTGLYLINASSSAELETGTYTLTIATPGAAATMRKVTGDGQTAAAGSPVAVKPAVQVLDAAGNAIPGVVVTFAVASGGGTVTGAVDTTDASGRAEVGGWTLGSSAGANTLTASATGLATATFTATATVATMVSQWVSTGGNHSCAVSGSAAYCFGQNHDGEVGDGSAGPWPNWPSDANQDPHRYLLPNLVTGGLTFTHVGTGYSGQSCGISGGAIYCWGKNWLTGQSTATPAQLSSPASFVTVDAGDRHSCALAADSTAHCWGAGSAGQIGNGSRAGQAAPTLVGGGMQFVALAVGGYHNCALAPDGTAYCWGQNHNNAAVGYGGRDQFSGGFAPDTALPVPVQGGHTFTAIAAGKYHSCGIVSGDIYCWGAKYRSGDMFNDGQPCEWTPQTGSTGFNRPIPCLLSAGGVKFTTIALGHAHGCAIATTGAAYCWGLNFSGQLGDGTQTDRTTPTLVAGGLSFASLDLGDGTSCGRTTSGETWCWGEAWDGQVGSGQSTAAILTPTAVRAP